MNDDDFDHSRLDERCAAPDLAPAGPDRAVTSTEASASRAIGAMAA